MMSKLLREPLGTVVYHAKVLLECQCIEEVRQEARRGTAEHFYRATPNSSLGSWDWQKVPAALRRDLVAVSLDSFASRVIQSLEQGAFEASDESSFTWQTITVDGCGRKELREILDEVRASFELIADRSKRRQGKKDGTPFVAAVAAFEAGSTRA